MPVSTLPTEQRIEQVKAYHRQTKHQFFRFAKSLGYMDWANQPDPFRRFAEAPATPLPILRLQDEPVSPTYGAIYSPGHVAAQPLTVRTLSRFFEYALGLTAWKQAGETRWALRSNPSSGNLHPTEGYVLLPSVEGVADGPGLYHYAPKDHVLERRATWPGDMLDRMLASFPPQAFLFGLTSVHWREAWKYGERAYRYCQHDAGHAIGTARVAAATLGWRMVLLESLSDDQLAQVFGADRTADFDGAEPEHPDCLAVVWPARTVSSRSAAPPTIPLSLDLPADRSAIVWKGNANRLSPQHVVEWDTIDHVAESCWKHERVPLDGEPVPSPSDGLHAIETVYPGNPSAGAMIHRRRSAVALDGITSITANQFFGMLARVMPRSTQPLLSRPMPWDVFPWPPSVHLALFVHRIDGLPPGLYMLVRDPVKIERLKALTHAQFDWTRPRDCPVDLPLYLLQAGDCRRAAAQLSCGQDIAADGAFSLGMLAEFRHALHRHGPWFYRRLFWETGLIGQILYLEAEAIGVRATGIGCFFDDPVHHLLGLADDEFQSLYHFTVGGPVEDTRLTTLPPYGEPRGSQ